MQGPQRVHIERKQPDAMALSVYEKLLVGQPAIRLDGLWELNEHYYLVCPDVNRGTRAADGSLLTHWLFYEISMSLPPIDIVKEPPTGSRNVQPRQVIATVELRGVTRTVRDIFTDLTLALGPEFPAFSLENPGGDLEIHVERELDERQLTVLKIAAESLDAAMAITILHPSKPSDSMTFYRARQGDLALLPSRALAADAPRKVRLLLEEDEDFWMSHRREALLGENAPSAASMFPDSWGGNALRCVVDATVFPAANIRSYLTLFDTVFLGLPLEEGFNEALDRLGVARPELAKLLETGRLKILLPQPIDRYPMDWLGEALEVDARSIVASRRIACGVLSDTRTRMPFLHPALDFDERRLLISALDSAAEAEDVPSELRRWFRVLSNMCRNTWDFAAECVQRQGALQTSRCGVGWLASELHKEFTGREQLIEIMGAARPVEWAAALGAHVFPNATETYSDEPACRLLAAISSPLDPTQIPVADPRVHRVVDGLLAIDSDVPAVEFARTFQGADVARFRRLVTELAAWNQDDSYLQAEIDRFNAEVRQYERRPDRLRTLNMAGFVSAAAAEAGPLLLGLPADSARTAAVEILRHVPLGVWFLGLLIGLGAEPTSRSAMLGRMWDHANGLLARTPPRAVMLSRLKEQAGG